MASVFFCCRWSQRHVSAPHLQPNTEKDLVFLEGIAGNRSQLLPLGWLHWGWARHVHAPWDGFGLVDLEERRCRKPGCLQMDLKAPYLPYCQGNGATRLSHLKQEDCTWRLGWSQPSHPRGHCSHACQAKRPRQPLSRSSGWTSPFPAFLTCPYFLTISILVLLSPPRPSDGAL